MMQDRSDLDDEFLGWLRSRSLDATADYLGRGRRFAGLEDDKLIELWRTVFRTMVQRPQISEIRTKHSDVIAEMELRGITPPLHEEKHHVDLLVSTMKERSVNDPDGSERGWDEALKEFKEFLSRRDGAQ